MPSFQKASFGKPPARKSSRPGMPSPEAAEAIGLSALVFLTEDEDRLARFLGESGLSPDELGQAAGRPEMLAAVLDHLLADESLLLVFAAHAGIDPAAIAPAQMVLVDAGSPSR